MRWKRLDHCLSDFELKPATDGSAGMDLAVMRWSEAPPWIALTGVAVEIPQGYVGLVSVRSSIGKSGWFMPHGIGVIDSDYRGEIQVPLRHVSGDESRRPFERGRRIAQLFVVPYLVEPIECVEELSDTLRGSGGFGSTGE